MSESREISEKMNIVNIRPVQNHKLMPEEIGDGAAGAGDGVVESHRRPPPDLGAHVGGVFAHIVASGLYPDGVVHDPVHDGIGVHS